MPVVFLTVLKMRYGYQTPASYAETIFAMGVGMPAPIANKAPKGIPTTAETLIRAG